MAGRPAIRTHDVRARDEMDKVILILCFFAGTAGNIALKLLEVHPFAAAGFSALVLTAYAGLAWGVTRLRLEPEVIGDNSYYLGFLFTLTSLSVTLYFVVESGGRDRATLIPEVISGFGVALASTIVGVAIRVLMMQLRLDIVTRERETRAEIDDAGRRLRSELAMAIEVMKRFGVESVQLAAEREAKFAEASRQVAAKAAEAMAAMSGALQDEIARTVHAQTAAAVGAIQASVAAASETALTQIAVSLNELANVSDAMRVSQATIREGTEEIGASLRVQLASLNDLSGQVARRLRALGDEIETSARPLISAMAEPHPRSRATVTLPGRRHADAAAEATGDDAAARGPGPAPAAGREAVPSARGDAEG